MKSYDVLPFIEAIREEGRLVRRAKLGDADAFVQLYDAYGDNVYRYIYFRVMNDVAAEAMTAHVFRHAWERLDDFPKRGSTFVRWIYTIARNQVILYYQINVRARPLEIGCLSAAVDYSLSTDSQDWTNQEAWTGHLRLLTAEKQYGLHQTATLLIMRRSLDHLSPGRKAKPAPTFNAYTRGWLTRYLQYHVRVPKRSPVVERLVTTYAILARSLQIRASLQKLSLVPERLVSAYGTLARSLQSQLSLLKSAPGTARMTLTYGALMAALLFTGTAEAQSALPGDALYSWKRTSEQAWLSVSPDPVGTGIILANRRLNEWIAVENDPVRSNNALNNYIDALTDLSSIGSTETVSRVVPVLNAHRKKLRDSGLASAQVAQVETWLAENPPLATAAAPVTSTKAPPTATAVATGTVATATPTATVTEVPTEVAATATPSATATPTEVPPTATPSPTEVPPTATPTDTPTEVPPTATPTDTPTEVPPSATPTDTPTEVPPTATPTDTPTEVPPTATPTETPTDVVPTLTAGAEFGLTPTDIAAGLP